VSGQRTTSHRELVTLPVGVEDPATNTIHRDAEVRAVTAGDELFIGTSPEYNRYPNDLVYKTLLLSRTVTRLGNKTNVTMEDIKRLHAMDLRALEYAVYRITYGEGVVPETPGPGG
jgi:hypothetical protein